MKKILSFLLLTGTTLISQEYKKLMEDPTVNFYDVCRSAEQYFKTIDISKKGSGFKQFQRWQNATERMYYPSGNRLRTDPLFVEHAFADYKAKNSEDFKKSNLTNASGWVELGPRSVDSITNHYAPGIGRIEDVYVDPSNPQKIYIGSRSGGLWRTFDEGANWVGGSTDFLSSCGVNTIAVRKENTDEFYVNLQNSNNRYSYGIYQSVDAGATLTPTAFNPDNLNLGGLGSDFRIYKIVFHPQIPDLLFIGTNKGLFRSTDDLTTWSKVIESGFFLDIEFHPTDPSILYTLNETRTAEGANFLLKSTDFGETFSKTQELTENNGAISRIAVTPTTPDRVYFSSANGIWQSDDSGDTFSSIAGKDNQGRFEVFASDTEPETLIYGNIDVFKKSGPNTQFEQITWWSLFRLPDGSGTLQNRYFTTKQYVHADLRVGRSINGILYMGTDGTLVKSEDNGTTWTDLMRNGVGVRENYKIGVSQSNSNLAVLGSQDNGTSLYNTKWIEYFGADGMEGFIHPINPNWIVNSIQNGARWKSTDGGVSISEITVPGSANGFWESPILFDPNDPMTIYDFRDAVHKSINFGDTYIQVGKPSFTGNIQQAEIAQNDSNIIVVSYRSAIEKSIDGGQTFTSIANNLPDLIIEDIAFDPKNDNTLFVVNASYQNNGQKVFQSNDGGATWQNITFNIGDIPVHTVVVDHQEPANIYIGTEVGVYVKPVDGNSWSLYNTNLPNTTVEELEINYGANKLFAATWGRGLWEYSLVNRTSFPKIVTTSLSSAPTFTTPVMGDAQFVTSTITYGSALKNVYVKWSLDTPTFTETIAMSNTTGDEWVSNTALPDAPAGTKVFFKVFAEGTNGDISETYKFTYTIRRCSAQGTSGTGNDYIANVKVGLYENPSGKGTYTSYENIGPFELTKGKTHPITVFTEAVFNLDKASAWIDYNQDEVFGNEERIVLSAYDNDTKSATGTITLPEDVQVNTPLRLRVRTAFTEDDPISPCGDVFGEVEDYTIVVIDPANTYCQVKATSNTGNDYIKKVSIGDFINTSEKTSYTFYDSLEPVPVQVGKSYKIEIQLESVFSLDKAGAWIDFNNDFIFDPEEVVIMSAYLDNNTATGIVTIPTSTEVGAVLRLRTRNSFSAESIHPCSKGIPGEIEDYQVVIIANENTYCDAKGKENTGNDYITSVQVNSTTNTSGKSAYSLFNTPSITLNKNQENNITVRIKQVFDSDKAGAWIDYNNNAVFEEEEAIILSAYSENLEATGTFTVPGEAVENVPLRMRVRNSFTPENVFPCGDEFGEVEDYIVLLAPPRTTYCDAEGAEGTTDDYINKMTLNDFVNQSDKQKYTYFDDLDPVQLDRNSTHTLGFSLLSSFDLDQPGAWIDFNQNFVFEPQEAITLSAFDDTFSTTGTFTIPEFVENNALLRLRIRVVYSENEPEPCGTVFGEVEDYTIQVIDQTLNIDENFNAERIKLIPNPADDATMIYSKNQIIDKILVFDVQGRLLQSMSVHTNKVKLDLNNLESAMYLINIQIEGQTFTKPIIKR